MVVSDQIALMQAYLNGATLERQFRLSRDCKPRDWVADIESGHDFNFAQYTYRVKPEPPKPREFWLGTCRRASGGNSWKVWEHETPPLGCEECERVLVREVLPES